MVRVDRKQIILSYFETKYPSILDLKLCTSDFMQVGYNVLCSKNSELKDSVQFDGYVLILDGCLLTDCIIENSVIESNCCVGQYSHIIKSYIEKDTHIDPKCTVINYIIKKNCIINKLCHVESKLYRCCEIGSNCIIEYNCNIKNSIIGNDTIIKYNNCINNTVIGEKSIIYENCNITDCCIKHHAGFPRGYKLSERFVPEYSIPGTTWFEHHDYD